ncbi:hypothetical protein SDC9_133327 [bioreactor metagenome]|uniref:Uncharacterized protein n=1 Tax=bioreactor metagenome TaxID=1076179 RepID=A0A645DAY4_9ZZZZ
MIGRIGFQQLIQIVHIGGKVLVVMKTEGLGIDIRLQHVVGIRQRRQSKGIVAFHERHPFRKCSSEQHMQKRRKLCAEWARRY